MLSDQERRDVLKVAREPLRRTRFWLRELALSRRSRRCASPNTRPKLGYDVAMVRTPHYYKKQMPPANMLAFYRTVADRSPLPVIIYNFPQATGYDIPAEVVIELAEHPNLIGIKESSGDVEKVRKMVEGTRHIKRSATVTETFDAVTPRMLAAAAAGSSNDGGELVPVGVLSGATEMKPSSSAVTVVGKMKTRQKEVGFQVLVGAAHKLQPSLDAGPSERFWHSRAPPPPPAMKSIAAWKEGDAELARLKQERISKAAQRVGGELGIPGLKYAMDLNGYYGGPSRLPFLPLTANSKDGDRATDGRMSETEEIALMKAARDGGTSNRLRSRKQMKAWSRRWQPRLRDWPQVHAALIFRIHRALSRRPDICLASPHAPQSSIGRTRSRSASMLRQRSFRSAVSTDERISLFPVEQR